MHLSRKFAGFTYLYLVLSSLFANIFLAFLLDKLIFSPIWVTIVISVFVIVLIFLPPFIMLNKRGFPLKETLHIKSLPASMIVLVTALSICVIIIYGMLKHLITFPIIMVLFPPHHWSSFMSPKPYPLLYGILAVCIVPSVLNGLMFQGIIQSGLEKLRAFRKCMIVGLLFALPYSDLFNLIPYIFIGFMMAFVVHKTGSVISGMLMYLLFSLAALFNFVAQLQGLIYPVLSRVGGTVVLIMVALAGGFFAIRKISRIGAATAEKLDEKNVFDNDNYYALVANNGTDVNQKGQNTGFISGAVVMAVLMLLRAAYTIYMGR